MRHKKDLDAIIGQSALFFIEHEKILESHFSPGRYAFNYLRSREISFDRNMLFKLINNDRNMFPQNFILKAH